MTGLIDGTLKLWRWFRAPSFWIELMSFLAAPASFAKVKRRAGAGLSAPPSVPSAFGDLPPANVLRFLGSSTRFGDRLGDLLALSRF